MYVQKSMWKKFMIIGHHSNCQTKSHISFQNCIGRDSLVLHTTALSLPFLSKTEIQTKIQQKRRNEIWPWLPVDCWYWCCYWYTVLSKNRIHMHLCAKFSIVSSFRLILNDYTGYQSARHCIQIEIMPEVNSIKINDSIQISRFFSNAL